MPVEANTLDDKKEDTAFLALECLDQLAQQKGLQGVSMRDVARALGISLAALQYHYPSKSALFDAFVQHSVARYRARIAGIANESDTQHRLSNVLAFIARETLAAAKGGVLAMIEARARHDEASHTALLSFMCSYLEVMGTIIRAEYPALPPSEVRLCSALVCSQLEGLAKTYQAALESGIEADDLVEATVRVAAWLVQQRTELLMYQPDASGKSADPTLHQTGLEPQCDAPRAGSA